MKWTRNLRKLSYDLQLRIELATFRLIIVLEKLNHTLEIFSPIYKTRSFDQWWRCRHKKFPFYVSLFYREYGTKTFDVWYFWVNVSYIHQSMMTLWTNMADGRVLQWIRLLPQTREVDGSGPRDDDLLLSWNFRWMFVVALWCCNDALCAHVIRFNFIQTKMFAQKMSKFFHWNYTKCYERDHVIYVNFA